MRPYIEIRNHGPLIVSTNFWETSVARSGKYVVSINDRCFRILLPEALEQAIPDMRTAKECVVSRGPDMRLSGADSFEILFDDHTSDPFALHMTSESLVNIPDQSWIDVPLTLSVWTKPHRSGSPRSVLLKPCWYRLVPQIPDLSPRKTTKPSAN